MYTLCCWTALTLLAVQPPTLTAQEQQDGFVPLFNGTDLAGWKTYGGKAENWTSADGLIVCQGKGGGWLGTTKEYDNFELRLEYRLKPGGNSGVYIRSPQEGHISRVGMEIQLLDDAHPRYAKLAPYQYTGAIYHVVPPTDKPSKPGGEWNTVAIRAQGTKIAVWVNAKQVVEADLKRYHKEEALVKEHPGLLRTTGLIGLQSHTDRVEFRNVRLKTLKAE